MESRLKLGITLSVTEILRGKHHTKQMCFAPHTARQQFDVLLCEHLRPRDLHHRVLVGVTLSKSSYIGVIFLLSHIFSHLESTEVKKWVPVSRVVRTGAQPMVELVSSMYHVRQALPIFFHFKCIPLQNQ